jgi:hypothetical protein
MPRRVEPSPLAIIEPIPGERMRFMVHSRSRPDVVHLVDVQEKTCSCEQHQFVVAPALKRGQRMEHGNWCWHMRRAREYLLDNMLSEIDQSVKAKA